MANSTKSDAAAKVIKGVKILMFTRLSKANGSNDGGTFFDFSLLQEIACTNGNNHTSHWSQYRKDPPVNKGKSKMLQASLIRVQQRDNPESTIGLDAET